MKKYLTLAIALVAVAFVKAQALDSDYVYAEPTTVGVPAMTANHAAYSFVTNNIRVSCSQGAIYADYFSCYAGATITFTTTQSMKGLTINGYLKKEFSGTASAGDMTYADATDDAVESNPVLVVTNINDTTITLSCVKQIRFYSIDFYFAANPEEEISGGDEGYSYEYEPTDVSSFNLTMDSLKVVDMTDLLGYTAVYLDLWNDEAEIALVAFVPYNATTGITPGTYPIDSTYAAGTIEASVGGDDSYDYESYLATNYTLIDGEWYYDPYYIVSGSLTVTSTQMVLNAATYNGSTIHAEYTFAPSALSTTATETRAVKYIEKGRMAIERNGELYDITGAKTASAKR